MEYMWWSTIYHQTSSKWAWLLVGPLVGWFGCNQIKPFKSHTWMRIQSFMIIMIVTIIIIKYHPISW